MNVLISSFRAFCCRLDGTTEDIKWGSDLVFSVGGKMYAVVNLEPPHTLAFKCTPETFAELVERDGIIPAPYLARAMWVQEREIGDVLERHEIERLVAASYELVKSKLPARGRAAKRRPTRGAGSAATSKRRRR